MGGSTQTTTTSPPSQVLQNYAGLTNRAQGVANTPYQPYTGELTAGINGGQSNAIGQLQSAYGTANPYLNAGSGYLNSAASGLGGVQNYLQAGSQAVAGGQQYQGQAAGLANPNANAAYMNPYTSSVINATMAEAQNQDAQQAQRLTSGSIGNGSFGGDRAGIGQAALAGQQALANNQTIAQLNSQNYQQANANRQADAGIYGNLANSSNQSASMYGSLGQTQGQTSAAMGQLAGQAGTLGNTAQSTAISGASAGLQASTLQQQNQQAQDTANYGQFQNSIQYPFQTTDFLSNIEQGIGNSSGSSKTSPGPSYLSQAAGAATAGLGILGQIGGSGGVSQGASTVANGVSSLFSGWERGGRVNRAYGGGLGGLRGRYADGGDPNAPPGLNFSANGLTSGGGFNPTASAMRGQQNGNLRQMQVNSGLAAAPASVGVLSDDVAASPTNLAPAAGGSSTPAGLAGDGSGASTPFGGGRNVSQALTAAGLGMMAGTSPFAMANIGQGGLAGLQTYQQLNAQDRQNAIAQSEIAYKSGLLGIDKSKVDMALQLQQRQINGARAAAGQPPIDFGSTPGSPSGSAPSAGSGSNQPVDLTRADSTAQKLVQAATQPAGGNAPNVAAAGAGPAAAGSVQPSFWTNVDPDSNPFILDQRANAAQNWGDTTAADALRTRAAAIRTGGKAMMRDGTTQTMPGYLDTVAAQKAAEGQGEIAGKPQTIYDADGNPQTVSGTDYLKAIKTGQPISNTQSPYTTAAVKNYDDFTTNAIKFNESYPSALNSLNSLAKIYGNYQGGRSADNIAEIANYAKQLGVAKALPDNWKENDTAYDAATKIVTKEGFDQLQASGLTKAPASGFREVNMTIPRPDMAPAARQKVIGDTIAQLQYQHDLINGVAASGDKNIIRAMNGFQKEHDFTDYAKKAQEQIPMGAGVTPEGAKMVGIPYRGPQAGADPSSQQPAQLQIRAPEQREAGKIYNTPKGKAMAVKRPDGTFGWQLMGN